MSVEAFLPCFRCGKVLENAFPSCENQPQEGTEFRTYGHYGSTFWDSMDGEELVLNVCDDCLTDHKERLAQHKRWLPITAYKTGYVGRMWVDRQMAPYSGQSSSEGLRMAPDELGRDIPGVDWQDEIQMLKEYAQQQLDGDTSAQN